MRTLLIITLLLYIAFKLTEGVQVAKDAQPYVEQIRANKHEPFIAYDYPNERGITQRMADTMQRINGKWYGNHQIPKSVANIGKRHYQCDQEPEWIVPAGRDAIKIKSQEGIYMWQKQQEKQKQQNLNEQDVREIVKQEMDERQ